MRPLVFLILIVSRFAVEAQPLRDVNYKYLYDGEQRFTMTLKPVRTSTQWLTFYELTLRDTTEDIANYSIQWERRTSLHEKEGTVIPMDSILSSPARHQLKGQLPVTLSEQHQIIAAKVINQNLKRAWYYYTVLDPKYPETLYLEKEGKPVLSRYVRSPGNVNLPGNSGATVFYYDATFPSATPPFSESMGRVQKFMEIDSTFTFPAQETVTLQKPGLYLMQYDTSLVEGLAFRVEDDYPRFGKLENLAGPLIYVCTKQEYERIRAAKGEKKAFDRVILSITGDAGRAKSFMKSYFRRVELANSYFTSYKEGWKTDRGMIFIIFGPPDEVFKFMDREVWNYKSDLFSGSFDFVRSPSLYDPQNYILVRNKKYELTWHEVVDLWRNARF